MTTDIAREIVKYAFENDVLTQHGMAGIKAKINAVITPADELHRLALERADKLMGAMSNSQDGEELSALADAIQAYEQARWPE